GDDTTLPTVTVPNTYTVEGCDVGVITDFAYTTTETTVTLAGYLALAGAAASDNCNIAGVTYQDGQAGSCPIVVTRTWRITDDCSNTTTVYQTINVDDTTPPVITVCAPNTTEYVDPSENFTIPDYSGLLTATDNCNPSPSLFQNPVPGSVISGIGTVHTLTLTVDDGCGNNAQCSFDITLEELDPLIITCPGNLNEYVDLNCEFMLPDYRSLAVVSGETGVTQLPAIGSLFTGPGTDITITLTAYNEYGATESCSFDVTLMDTISPVAVCQGITIQLDATGNATIVAADLDTGSTDNCGIASLEVIPNGFTCSEIGENMVTLTATDINGNTSQCSAVVTVQDLIQPQINCPGDAIMTAASGECSMVVNGIAPQYAGDNCGVHMINYKLEGATTGNGSDDASGSSFNSGVTTVWYRVTDLAGNGDSCSFQVVVLTSALPPDDAFVDRASICPGDGNITLSYSGGSEGESTTAVWYKNDDFTMVVGTGNALVLPAPDTTTSYFVRFESDCDTTSAASVTVSTFDVPAPTFIEMEDKACIDGPLYRYVAGGRTGSLFTWDITVGAIVSNRNDTILVDWGTASNSGILELTETTIEGCISVPVTLYVNIGGPSLDLGENVIFCAGESVTITPEEAFFSYLWHDGSTGRQYTADQEGWVVLEVNDSNACSAYDSLYVLELEPPFVDLGPDTTVCSTGGIVLDAGDAGDAYSWSTGDKSQQITVFNEGTQEIWVEVQNSDGCTGSDTVLVRECDLSHLIDIPTGITPNDDGVNDVWNILALKEFEDAVVDIFDQWGTLVWRSAPGYPEPWDGRDMKEKPVPVDSYHFVIHFNDGSDKRHIGYITVIR
ncbi:MAG: gliding motility-associated C-terminal domain-containing protein, partial [Bacteroidota bacterium]